MTQANSAVDKVKIGSAAAGALAVGVNCFWSNGNPCTC
jgi:hypothetical protein